MVIHIVKVRAYDRRSPRSKTVVVHKKKSTSLSNYGMKEVSHRGKSKMIYTGAEGLKFKNSISPSSYKQTISEKKGGKVVIRRRKYQVVR